MAGVSAAYASEAGTLSGTTAIVTGSSGFVGRRLCEVLAERGASKVIGLDVRPWSGPAEKTAPPASHSVIEYRQCDITNRDQVLTVTESVDCLYHIAALVGPFHPRHLYDKVNYEGTLHILDACKQHGIKRMIYSSSPSTRFDGSNVSGATEADMKIREPGQFLEPYAEAKAKGEVASHNACEDSLDGFLTAAVAPHQVYGPQDPIFLPNLMEAAKSGKLRVFGSGRNCISMVHVDNYCHGLICGYHSLNREDALENVARQYFVVTDGGKVEFWKALDEAAVFLGYRSLLAKMHLPKWLLLAVAYVGRMFSAISGRSFKLTPFTVTMLTIDRWFDITKARTHLRYEPAISFEDGWKSTLEWFKENPEWLQKCADKTSANKVFDKSKQA